MYRRLFVVPFLATYAVLVQGALGPVQVGQESIDPDACVLLKSMTCKTLRGDWQDVCANWHYQLGSQLPSTHYVITEIQEPNKVLFVGKKARVIADHYDCGQNGMAAVGSVRYAEQQAVQQERQATELEELRKEIEQRAAVGTGEWKSHVDTDAMTDEIQHFISLQAMKQRGGRGLSSLIVRCADARLELYLAWEKFIDLDNHEVMERFDSDAPTTSIWNISTSHASSFHPKPMATVDRLLTADKYAVRVEPYSDNPLTAVFEVKGFAAAVKPVIEACGHEPFSEQAESKTKLSN